MPSPQRIARDPWLDNAKMALVTLVVIGHAWELLPPDELNSRIYDFLYAWHMPAFVFIAGYLTRTFDYSPERLWQLVRTVVVPYVVFECLLALFRLHVGGERLEDLFTDPHWPLWFLAALACWRLLTPLFLALPAVLAVLVAVLVSLAAGTMDADTVRFLDLARVLGFLPFFVLGLHTTSDRLELLRGPAVRWQAGAVLGGVWLLSARSDDLAGTQWLYYSVPYADLGATDAEGALTRLGVLAVGGAAGLAFLALVPRVDGWFTRMGSATLVVYLCHGFVVLGLGYAGFDDWAAQHPGQALPVTVVVGALLAIGLAARPVARRLELVVDPFGHAEQQVQQAVELTVVAQDPGSLPAMQNQMAAR